MSTEKWKPIPGYEGIYEISNLGHIHSLPRSDAKGGKRKGKQLNPWSNAKGYQLVRLYDTKGGARTFQLHRLVMLAFVGTCPGLYQVNHKNCDKADNRLCNLEYVTPEANLSHAKQNGRHPAPPRRGEDNNTAKLTSGQVITIRREYAEGNISLRQLGDRYGVSKQAIHHIVQCKSWTHLDDHAKPRIGLTPSKALDDLPLFAGLEAE